MTSSNNTKSPSLSSAKLKLPGDGYSEWIRARFWVVNPEGAYVGIGRITSLEAIHKTGSINQAAKSMKMSYKKAWKLVDDMNQLMDKPLVIKAQGGSSGGGTVLTSEGLWVLDQFRELEKRLQKFLEQESQQLTKAFNSLK